MFRVIYPNRYLIWTISLLLIMALLLWGAIERFKVEEEISMQESIASSIIHRGSMAGWKTYRNEEYGFEIKYPPRWYVEYSKNHLAISERKSLPNSDQLEDFVINILNVSVSRAVADFETNLDGDTTFGQGCHKTTFMNLEAFKCFMIGLTGFDDIIFSKDGHTFNVVDTRLDDISELIISTFKFIK